MLVFAIVTITFALVFYTFGVFGERKAHLLKKNHVILFYLGLICDTIGTLTMTRLAASSNIMASPFIAEIHGITGLLAILLMLFHAIWATYVLAKNDEKKKATFHKFSLTVWLIWLVPYFVGMVLGMI